MKSKFKSPIHDIKSDDIWKCLYLRIGSINISSSFDINYLSDQSHEILEYISEAKKIVNQWSANNNLLHQYEQRKNDS
ncbi:MAG: hypothetical protein EAX86_03005 [Candidatus Heimdallarchaeota archaeon]|nr:hypothetical protein [Candidatus Heimdallarchaeota archaeon]